MRIIEGAAEARKTVLKRTPASETELGPSGRARNLEVFGEELSASEAVVQHYGKAFDGAASKHLEVPRDEIDAALHGIEPELREALQFAAGRVRSYHEGQMRRVLASYL